MDPYFVLMENIKTQITGKIYQMINMSKGDPDTPTLNEATKRTYNDEFMQTTTQEIKELEQHGTWTIVSRKSMTGDHILTSTWGFKVKRFPDDRFRNFKARFCARGDRQVEGAY